ncbi:hypothetical protein [Streptomyces chartreusis]|uniref:Uncharacterized protein n=1 Tax=Streptomyces chartreusis TaxID=1969 RepID=A0A7I0Y8U7_STRCX|nr:hypothetical protein [Streptomyces chartreusis]QKZ15928.1 hypothetical protein HUT05_33455 [Streptomyces chartreusis]
MARRPLTLLAALLLALSLGQTSASAASFANPVKSWSSTPRTAPARTAPTCVSGRG